MFEDSTFETMGRIHTRSRGWMMATLAFNSSILLALAIIPILHPEMLPPITFINPIDAPTPIQQRPAVRTEAAQSVPTASRPDPFMAPTIIPPKPWIPGRGEDPGPIGPIDLSGGPNATGSKDDPFNGRGTQPNVRQAMPVATQHVSSVLMQGMLIYKVVPAYPAIAQAIHTSGTVILQATISKSGAIENLRVVDGPAMLRQAALDAVRQWRYKPYLLNGQPVEVETTVNVEFKME